MATNSKFSADLGLKTDADLQVDGNVTVSGNLTVNGTSTTVNSTTTSVEDSMLELANQNTSSDILDIGIYGNYDDGLGDGTSEYTGLFRDATDSTWKLFDGLEAEPTTTVNTSGSGYSLADLQVGDLTATTLTATNSLTGSSITYPTSDGTNGQFLKTNGSGVLSFGDIPTQYTDSDARSAISVSGDLSYDSSTGVISYSDSDTTYTDSDARSAISGGTGISYDSSTGVITNTVTNTDTTYSAGTGLSLSGTTFSSTITQYADSDVESYLDGGTSTPTFSTATVTGDLTVDTSTLVVDATNDKVGIGITSNLNANLHIGSANATGNATNPAFQIGGDSNANNYRLGFYTSTEGGVIENKNGDDGLQFRVKTAGEAMRIDGGSGNVGIGTQSPSDKLEISGTGSTRLKITNTDTDWAALDIEAGGNQANYVFFRDDSAERARFQVQDSNDIIISNGSSPTERMRIHEEGYITMPNQVAFSVSKNNGYQTDDAVFVCDYATGSRNHNDGSHYNTSNGRFTAPVAGRYFFSFSVMTHDSGSAVQAWIALRKNGSILQYNWQHKTGQYHTRFDMSMSVKLAANDYIEAYVGESGTSSGWQGSASEYNNFSGFLIG